MRLSVDQVREITQGVVSVVEHEGSICLHRFTKEQEDFYSNRYNGCRRKYSTAGVKIVFQTDSPWLELSVDVLESTSRTYFSIDVFVDTNKISSIDNFSDIDMSGDYSVKQCPLGYFEKRFELGDGIKLITIVLPWSVEVRIQSLCLEDASIINPICSQKKLLVYGDSITHGYDAKHSQNRFTAQVAESLHAVEYNRAIGGEVFVPQLLELNEPINPDYILVAYGTNDWGLTTYNEFTNNCKEFFSILAEKYPNAKIFALAPVWRKSYREVRQCCDFRYVAEYMRKVTSSYPNIFFIDCFDFIPHESTMYADVKVIHPSDLGFEYYGRNLVDKIQEIL